MTKPNNGDKHLTSLPLFWLAIATPFLACAAMMYFIYQNDNMKSIILTKDSIATAYDHFRFPLLVASLIFPLVAVVIAGHRSAQTLMMADLQSSQNRFANYYLHLDKFKEAMSTINNYGERISLKAIHDKLYPGLLSDGILDIDFDIHKDTEELLDLMDMISIDVASLEVEYNFTEAESQKWRSELMPLTSHYGYDLQETAESGHIRDDKLFVALSATKIIENVRCELTLERRISSRGYDISETLRLTLAIINDIRSFNGQTRTVRIFSSVYDLLNSISSTPPISEKDS